MAVKRLVLHFPPRLVDQPITSRLVKEHDLEFNILKAQVTPGQEGLLVMEIAGDNENVTNAMNFLKELGVKTQLLSQDVRRNEQLCVHCGVCVPICPAEAFSVDPDTALVSFDDSRCIACELCVKACPYKAMTVHF